MGQEHSPESGRPLVLVAGGSADFLTRVGRALEEACFRTVVATSGDEALAQARKAAGDGAGFSAAVVDAFLPDVTGLGLCRLLREDETAASLPVLIVSGYAREIDRVLAFENGADDFVAHPFYGRELASRVRAVQRREARRARGGRAAAPDQYGPLALDLRRGSVEVDGRRVRLTLREFHLLRTLIEHEGKVLERRELVEHEAAPADAASLRVIDTHVKSIRRKLGRARACIETVRGVGYRFSADGLRALG